METQIVTLVSPGQLDSLALRSAPRRPPRPDEVEIEVEAVGLNFKDVLLALGVLPTAEDGASGLGFECVGRISRVGAQVSSLSVGDEVLAMGRGCLATAVCTAAETVHRRPKELAPLDAVTLPVAFVTATYALEEVARLRGGERVLIHTATGGVGLAAIQIAQRVGAEIFATAGSEAKREYLRGLGVAHVMDSRTAAFAEEILAKTQGAGVDVVLNSLSGELLERSLAVLAPHGRFIELGARDALEGRALALSLFARGASFCALGYSGALPRLGSRLADVVARAESGEFKPLPRRSFAVSEVGEAFSHLARARHIGKVVVALRGEVAVEISGERDDPTRDYLLPAEGVEIFELCLAAGRPRVIVSKLPLEPRLAKPPLLPPAPAAPLAMASAANGQLSRAAHRRFHPRPALDVAFLAPRNADETKLAEVWARCLGLESVGVNDDFFALGGDSLFAVQLAHQLRTALRIELPAHLVLENPTIAALSSRLGQPPAAQDNASLHLVRLSSEPTSARPLFLVHPVGGHVYFYLPLAHGLVGAAPVYGLQARGVDGEAPPLSTVEEMAASYLAALRSVQWRGPYRLGGASFGGVVAFEMAQQLARAGEAVELLALIDSPGPGALPAGFREDAEILAYLLARGSAEDRHLRALSALSAQSEDQMLRYFLQHGGGKERLSPDATVESVRHFLRLFRANFDALLRYEPRPYPGSGLFFCADEPDGFNPPGLSRAWAPFFRSLELVQVPGNHTTMNQPPNVGVIAQRLRTALGQQGARS